VNVPGIDDDIDDEHKVIQLSRYRRPSRARRLRYALPDVELTPTTLLAAAFVVLLFVVFPIRLLWSTTPEFRGLVLTTVGWAAGLTVVGLAAWKLAPAVWRYARERLDREN
jgi:hypothetical protein